MNNKLGKIITMPDFLKNRYTPRTGSWLSIITLIAYVLTKVSVTAFTGGISCRSSWLAFLVWSYRIDSVNGYLHYFGRHEGCNDTVGNSNAYTYSWFIPCAFPRIIGARRWQYYSWLDCNDRLF